MSDHEKSPEPEPRKDIMQVLAEIWADQKARGHVPRTAEEIQAELRAFRDEAEEEFLAAEKLHEECQRAKAEAETEAVRRSPE